MADVPARGASAPRPVRVLNVDTENPQLVRFLGPYSGAVLHWVRSGKRWRFFPCPGEDDCPASYHSSRASWKAWAPAEHLDQTSLLWWPVAVELTANMEELLRGRQLRGEVWSLWRELTPKKALALTGALVEQHNPDGLRPAFDVLPVLLRVYQVLKIRIGVPNPYPAKLLMEAAQGALPSQLARIDTTEHVGPTPEQLAHIRSHWTRPGSKPPQPSGNGHNGKASDHDQATG